MARYTRRPSQSIRLSNHDPKDLMCIPFPGKTENGMHFLLLQDPSAKVLHPEMPFFANRDAFPDSRYGIPIKICIPLSCFSWKRMQFIHISNITSRFTKKECIPNHVNHQNRMHFFGKTANIPPGGIRYKYSQSPVKYTTAFL